MPWPVSYCSFRQRLSVEHDRQLFYTGPRHGAVGRSKKLIGLNLNARDYYYPVGSLQPHQL